MQPCNCDNDALANRVTERIGTEASDLERSLWPIGREISASARTDSRGSSRTRTRADTVLLIKKRRRWCCVLVPTYSKALRFWDTFIVLLLFTVCVVTPYGTAFGELCFDWMFCFNRFTEMSFIVDMLLKFFTAIPHPMKRGCWISDPHVIVLNYLGGFFFFDLISIVSLPLDTLALLDDSWKDEDYSWMKLCRTIRILRLSSVFQHGQTEHLLTYFGVANWKLGMVKLFFILSITCHWSACVWGSTVRKGAPEPNWLLALENAKGGSEDLYLEPQNTYTLSLYWAITTITTIGYGDITPQNNTEYLWSLGLMAIMAAVWTYILGEICAIQMTLSPQFFEQSRNMDDMNWLLAEWDVPHESRIRMRRYLLESHNKIRFRQNKQIIALVSTTMQGELAEAVNKGWTEKVSYLRGIGNDEVAEISQQLDTQMFAPHEEEHFSRTLCIVERGSCARQGRVYSRCDVWGEDIVLSNPLLREEASSKALSYLQLLTLSWKQLEEVASLYAGLQHNISMARLHIGLRRGFLLIARVMKELDFEGAISIRTLTSNQYFSLSDAICAGVVQAGMSRELIHKKTGLLNQPIDELVAAALGTSTGGQQSSTSTDLMSFSPPHSRVPSRIPSRSPPRLPAQKSTGFEDLCAPKRPAERTRSPLQSPRLPQVTEKVRTEPRTSTIHPARMSEVRARAAELSARMAAMNDDIKAFLDKSNGVVLHCDRV